MKILCLTDVAWPDFTGGITKCIVPEIDGLVDLNHEITVMSRWLDHSYPKCEKRDGYEVIRYFSPSKKTIFRFLYPIFTILWMPIILKQITAQSSGKFDIAYVHNAFQGFSLTLFFNKIPCMYSYHASCYKEIGIDSDRGKYGLLTIFVNVARKVVFLIERRALIKSTKIIVDSEFMKEDLLKLYPEVDRGKVITLSLCIDTEKFYSSKNRVELRNKLGIPTDRIVLLTIRRLVARMGIENLLTSVSKIIEIFPEVILIIGGSGYLKESIEKTIKELTLESNVILTGFIDEELLPEYYTAADMFVLPTLEYEGFGLVTIESYSCGTPVAATPIGANRENVDSKFLFRDNTSDAIADGIIALLSKGLRDEDRQYNRSMCIEKFGKQKICSMLEKVLQESII
jgi:glycosyltransferase involved in cell wall biosynthesis